MDAREEEEWADQCSGCGAPTECEYATMCTDPECAAQFYCGEEGFDSDQCFECGAETQEINA